MRNNQIAIIGGGQLGMLLCQTAMVYPAHVSIYDPNLNCSASFFTSDFRQGDFSDVENIVDFARNADAVIFETEKTSIEALEKLEEMGKIVLSSPKDLKWIKNKASQREKLAKKGYKVPKFEKVKAEDVKKYSGNFPIVQKWQKGGYDGLGVQIHQDKESLKKASEIDSVFEEMIDIEMELSVIIARNNKGEIKVYSPVEMVFDKKANLVDYLIAPARISDLIREKLEETVRKMAEDFDFFGVYVIEFFLDKNKEIYVNEVSPRVHNSGHHTISANVNSQYDQQIRIALNLPLGSVKQISPCVMLNLLAEESSGNTIYKGLEEAYKIPRVKYTFYGKEQVRPKRKMGHALILEDDLNKSLDKIRIIKNTLKISNHE